MSAARLLRAATRRMAALTTATSTRASVPAAPAPRGLATLVARKPVLPSASASAAWPAAARPQHRRATAAFASGAGGGGSSNVNAGLADALEDEIKYEAENYEAPTGITNPPAGWGLDEAPGDTLVSLTRQGILPGEIVTVELLVDEQDDDDDDEAALFEGADDDEDEDEEEGGKSKADDEDDDDLDFDESVIFTAAVARGESALVFECRSDGSYLQVLSVSLEPNPDAAGEGGEGDDDDLAAFDDDTRYVGPLYDELDERLQAEFEAYLAARGIDAELGGFLAAFASDKEQREYVAWLERVKAFVSQK